MLVRAILMGLLGFWLSWAISAQTTPTQAERVRGSYLGLVYGDAYGTLTENFSEAQSLMAYGNLDGIPLEVPYLHILKAVGETQFLKTRPLGLNSDDSQQATLLAIIGLVHQREWNELATRAWTHELVSLTKENVWRGQGPMFDKAVNNLVRGHGYKISGSYSAGIGAAMRTPVLGSIYRLDVDSLRKATVESSLVTHAEVRAVALAYAVSWIVYALLNDMPLEAIRNRLPLEVLHIERECLRLSTKGWQIYTLHPHEISNSLRNILAQVPRSADELRHLIIENAVKITGKQASELSVNNSYSLLGGIHAVLLPLLQDVDPKQALNEIVLLGNDSDTVAAIAGALLGARFGESWIPHRELKFFDRWNRMAKELNLEKPMPDAKMEHFVAYERAARSLENQFQRDCAQRLPALKKLLTP